MDTIDAVADGTSFGPCAAAWSCSLQATLQCCQSVEAQPSSYFPVIAIAR